MAEIIIKPLPGNINSAIGMQFGRLSVIGYAGKFKRVHKWVADCDCGNRVIRRLDHMRSGRSKSCGCLNAEVQRNNFQKHGGAVMDKSKRHPLYSIWCGMKKRCYTPSCDSYPYYGGRGIKVCDKWKNNFSAFVADMGDRPQGTTLDRVDGDRDYSPENCRWADHSTQMKNRKPFKRLV